MNFLNLIPEGDNIAVIGGGGKSGLIRVLAEDLLAARRPVLVSVTTRLGRCDFPGLQPVEAADLDEALTAARRAGRGERVLLTGPFQPDNMTHNKFTGAPTGWFPALRRVVPPNLTLLVEADGSARRPLKAHRAGEPVFPPLDNYVVAVVGLSALLKPWPDVVHRPEILTRYIESPPEDEPLTPEAVADFIVAAWAPFEPKLIFLNQVDLLATESAKQLGRRLADQLIAKNFPVAVGSLTQRSYFRWGRL